ncbi:hypothetical protein GGR53DRAFT_490503 [Hypoxylon sp. FL1150]|nr:hypothetical protein GGR53DRAFT_490503 [Hypoxylon sp. FL1150]
MRQLILPSLWLLFLGTASCSLAGSPAGKLSLWTVSEERPAEEQDDCRQFPTWYAQYPTEYVEVDDPESYETNLDLAKTHYDWLMDQENHQSNQLNDYGWIGVSVMFDPISRWHFVSTVPRGPRAKFMAASYSSAPRWYHQISNGDNSTIVFQAQDAVFFNYETSDKAQAGNKTYPRGGIVATYGAQYDNDKAIHGPGMIPACTGTDIDSKSPSCQSVAGGLGVTFAAITAGYEWADTTNITSEKYSLNEKGGATSAELQGMLCEWQQQSNNTHPSRQVESRARRPAELAARNQSSCYTELKAPTPVSTFSYTGTVGYVPHNNTVPVMTTPQSSVLPQITPKLMSTPSCYVHDSDPDHGNDCRYCVCDETRTLPFLSFTTDAPESKSCEYTTLPPKDGAKRDFVPTTTAQPPPITPDPAGSLRDRDLTITTGFGPVSTDTFYCKVCTPIAPYAASCSSLAGCQPSKGTVTLEAGSSSVHVGTLTGDALYTSVSNALDKICPTPSASGGDFTSCSTDGAVIEGIDYISEDALLTSGELVVSVESSKYNETNIRDALIKTAAAAAQNAAVGTNCYQQGYNSLLRRSWWMPDLFRRDRLHVTRQQITFCNTVGFAGPHYYSPWWKTAGPGATDYIDARWEFHGNSGVEDFACSLLEAAVDAFAFVEPEFTVADIELGELIDIVCKGEGEDTKRRDVDNSTIT